MADKYTCTGSSVRIRSGPGMQFGQIGSLYKGQVVEFVSQQGAWIQHNLGGWSSSNYLALTEKDAGTGATAIPDTTTVTDETNADASGSGTVSSDGVNSSGSGVSGTSAAASTTRKEVDLAELTEEEIGGDYPLEPSSFESLEISSKEYLNMLDSSLKVHTTRGIHGMPYQFLPVVDNRIDGSEDNNVFGRKFADKIVAKMPLLLMTPGTAKFMSSFSEEERRQVLLSSIFGVVDNNAKDSLMNTMSKDGRYYSFKNQYNEYFQYVRAMAKIMANYMGVGDKEVNGKKLGGPFNGIFGSFDWEKDIQSDISKLTRFANCTAWYIDSEKQISENLSNETTESMLKSSINGLSDYARELQFLLGTSAYAVGTGSVASRADALFGQDQLNANIESVNEFINKVMPGQTGGIFTRLTSNIQTLVAGGKLIFPEIWSDSSFGGRSYDISLKLRCPDPTPLGIFLDIMIPIIHIICFTAPRSSTANGYVSPFLVRAFYKGMFNVDMGIITSLNITRGAEGSWSRSGIPTSVDINFTIKDLYSSLTISKADSYQPIMDNLPLLDFLANMAGININEPDVFRQIELYLGAGAVSRISDFLRFDMFRGLEQWVGNTAMFIYDRLFR